MLEEKEAVMDHIGGSTGRSMSTKAKITLRQCEHNLCAK